MFRDLEQTVPIAEVIKSQKPNPNALRREAVFLIEHNLLQGLLRLHVSFADRTRHRMLFYIPRHVGRERKTCFPRLRFA